MTKAYKYEQHLLALLVEEKQCFQDGDWERLDRIRLAIDDTTEQVAKAKKFLQDHVQFIHVG